MAIKYKIAVIAGARPNFIKVAPLLKKLGKHRCMKICLIHTGQHYDYMMSNIFFKELHIPKPDIYLGIKEPNQLKRIIKMVQRLEKVFDRIKPDMVVVVGDVDSTFAAGLTAYRMNIKLAHVEAGLRSYNIAMREEINRIFVDRVSDLLFAPTQGAVKNLLKEGVPKQKIFLTGDIMIDTLKAHLDEIKSSSPLAGDYCLMTFHRAENINSSRRWRQLIKALTDIGKRVDIIYPAHPHSKKMLDKFGLWKRFKAIKGLAVLPPASYMNFLQLTANSRFVMTDSGGIQEEAAFLDVPCLTLRDETERPVTIELGTNILTGLNHRKILKAVDNILKGRAKHSKKIPYWDGNTSDRIASIILRTFRGKR